VAETAEATLRKSLTFEGFVGAIDFVAGYMAGIPIRALIGPIAKVLDIAVGSPLASRQ
jgi:hypothetical protein